MADRVVVPRALPGIGGGERPWSLPRNLLGARAAGWCSGRRKLERPRSGPPPPRRGAGLRRSTGAAWLGAPTSSCPRSATARRRACCTWRRASRAGGVAPRSYRALRWHRSSSTSTMCCLSHTTPTMCCLSHTHRPERSGRRSAASRDGRRDARRCWAPRIDEAARRVLDRRGTHPCIDLDDVKALLDRGIRPTEVVRNRPRTQAIAAGIFGEQRWSGIQWWSYQRSQWTSSALWDTDALVVERVEEIPGHPRAGGRRASARQGPHRLLVADQRVFRVGGHASA